MHVKLNEKIHQLQICKNMNLSLISLVEADVDL